MNAGARPPLRLLLNSVDIRDATRLNVFLRLGESRLNERWEIVEDGHVDACIVGSDEAKTLSGEFELPRVVARIVEPHDAQDDLLWLARPIQYDAVIDALLLMERTIADARAADARESDMRAARPLSTQPGRLPPSVAPTPPPRVEFRPGTLFRLRRWPPMSLLAEHPHHLRLASFLSARPVGLDHLARLGNVDKARCESFLAALSRIDMLQITTCLAEPPAVAPPAPVAASPSTPPRPAGLFPRIRRSLGISWA